MRFDFRKVSKVSSNTDTDLTRKTTFGVETSFVSSSKSNCRGSPGGGGSNFSDEISESKLIGFIKFLDWIKLKGVYKKTFAFDLS